ncbi:hypothetical protein KAR91_39155 [Candidatus Pacearchaeota archaeon]|nr:hypothetical protein [Candidatus Pacearchaeota archaeon]
MPTSGSFDWTLTRDEIIRQAMEDIGAIDVGNSPSTEEIAVGSRRLNGIVKRLQHNHVALWTLEQAQQTLTPSSGVTNGGTTYRCILSHTSAADNEPGVGGNWTTFWFEDGNANSPTAWLTATAYSSVGDFTVDADTIGIDFAFLRENNADYPIEIITREDYSNILTKYDEGKAYKLVFDRQVIPRCYLYYQPDNFDHVIHYTRVRKLEDFDSGQNNFDGPVSWLPLLIKMLAHDLCGIYSIPWQERNILKSEVKELLKQAKQFDSESSDGDFIEGAFAWRRYGWRNQRRRF